MPSEPIEPLFNPDDLDLYTIGGYIPISGEWARQIERGEPIVLWVGGLHDEDDDDAG